MTQTTDAIAALERLEAIVKLGFDLDWDEEYRAAVPALCRALRLALSAIVYALDVMDADGSIKEARHIRGLVHAVAAELEATV